MWIGSARRATRGRKRTDRKQDLATHVQLDKIPCPRDATSSMYIHLNLVSSRRVPLVLKILILPT